MTEFAPPIPERETEELIAIAHSSIEHWQKEAISQAKRELLKRGVPYEEQIKLIEERKTDTAEFLKYEAKRLENNKTESYKIWEMVVLFLFGPFLFLHPYLLNSHTLFTLRGENYYLKFKQRIIIFGLSFVAWFFYMNYSFEQSEKNRLEEIEKIDISDWKEKHGYD